MRLLKFLKILPVILTFAVPILIGSVGIVDTAQAAKEYDDIELYAPFPGEDPLISTKEQDAIGILGTYVSQVFTFGMALIAIFAVIMIMVGGYEYMFAGGDSSKADGAKSRISQALLGLVLVFLSALLLSILNPNFYKI